MAYASNSDELRQKVAALCIARYGANTPELKRKLFMSYDLDGDEHLNSDEVYQLLADANVGNVVTRGAWVSGIFEQVDKDPADGKLSWTEYLAASSVDGAPVAKDTGAGADDPLGKLGDMAAKAAKPVISEVPGGQPESSSPVARFVVGAAVGAALGLLLRR